MNLILVVPCVAAAALVSHILLALLLRPWIYLPLLPFSNRRERQTTLRGLRFPVYVLIVGVLQWGWPCFAGLMLSEYLSEHSWGPSLEIFSAHGLVRSFWIWTAMGVGYGFFMWVLTATHNDGEITQRSR